MDDRMKAFDEWHLMRDMPDRSDSGDWRWAKRALRAIAGTIDPAAAVEEVALRRLEAARSRLRGRANRVLADIGGLQNWPLSWPSGVEDFPIAVGGRHIRLKAVTFEDIEQAELEQRERLERNARAAQRMIDGLSWLGIEMRRRNRLTLADAGWPTYSPPRTRTG